MIAVGFGSNDSLKVIKHMYAHGYATKDDYAKALQAYQAYLGEVKSDDRDKAAAYDEQYKYYEWCNAIRDSLFTQSFTRFLVEIRSED